ncbi:MAG: L28 family ribosomal protein [Candidatus Omnitrophica bacterium]|nr:L28 family ribosomal protein [Candidatus Omnitrophota bacterium]MDD5351995.1 L28 family ribosomal protein [Candidatus Omnitrophota bacterium]MDD5551049.1 L28 family ribosomal protein [Candidatus Omnitrophota bacterium]
MSRICSVCGKIPVAGRSIKRRGMAKKKGGAGKKIVGISRRFFRPNIQRIRVMTPQGRRYIYICVKCLKANKAIKAVKKTSL